MKRTLSFYNKNNAISFVLNKQLNAIDVHSRPLRKHKYAQCEVEWNDWGDAKLVSYSTDVLFITSDGYVFCTGLYSRTTRRHISWYLSEQYLGLDYYGVANLLDTKSIYNYHTEKFITKDEFAKKLGIYNKYDNNVKCEYYCVDFDAEF